MAQLTRKGTSPNVNVTLLKKTGFEGKTLPCQLCRKALEIRLSKNLKPYCVCNDCSIQVFFRGKTAIRRLRNLVNSQKSIPDGEINSDSAVEIFASLETLKLQRKQLTEKRGLIFRDQDLENTISAVDKEIQKLQGVLDEMAGNSPEREKR